MPSTYSARARYTLQAPGENLNLWGVILNQGVFALIDDARSKRVAFPLSGTKTLTTVNGAADEARSAFIDITGGSGGTVIIPSVEWFYVVRNAATGPVAVTTGAGAIATLVPGVLAVVVCDAANVRTVQSSDFAGQRVTGVGAPIASSDGVPKSYVDGLAFGAVNLPGQGPGTIGQFVKSDGDTASWSALEVADVAGAAPLVAPDFTGGVSVAGPVDLIGVVTQTGGTVGNVTALAALDIDFTSADAHTKSINTDSAFTFSGFVTGKLQCALVVLTISSSAVPSWPASVRHPTGVNPSATLGNGKHLLGLITANGGTEVVLVVLARNFS